MPSVVDAPDVVELCRHQAERFPDRRSHVFLDSGVVESDALTFAELDRRARAIAARLRDLAPPAACAVLSYPPGLEFVPAFLGCLYAGVIPVPAPATRRTSGDPRFTRLVEIVTNCRPELLLSTSALLTGSSRMDAPKPLQTLATDLVSAGEADRWTPTRISPGSVAYVQYTSGTTGRPKGVVLTHENVVGNLSLILAHGSRGDERLADLPPTVTWLPLFHDMGLIGGVLQPLYLGHTSVLMSPQSFARSPVTWLSALDRYESEFCAAPSLGYDLCLRRITPAQREDLDLSRLRVAVISDEPLRPSTVEGFSEAFAPTGFRRAAFFPSFGMAESTVLISGGPLDGDPVITAFDAEELAHGRVRVVAPPAAEGELPHGSPAQGDPRISSHHAGTTIPGAVKRLVACGAPDPSLEVVITDPDTGQPAEVGEIRVAGPSVGIGYWNDPEASRRTFGRHLNTGNLGFRHDGLLYVLGRLTDVITRDGRMLLPQDLEAAAVAAHPSIRAACAFADPDGRVVVLAETREDLAVTLPDVDRVVPVRPGTLLFTTSGKLRRAACRAAWLSTNRRTS